jgi:hypothetical protein
MVCATMKQGIECIFMKKNGCSYNGGQCYTVVENCEGCVRVQDLTTGRFCSSFPLPAQKWQKAVCSMSSHVQKAKKLEVQKINPLKASKRNAGKK